MFTLHAVQAQFGDCLILEYGTPAKPRFTLIDGGPPKNYTKDLKAALDEIVTTKKLDLTVLSHVDYDHVVGLMDFFADLEREVANGQSPTYKIGGVWHNSFQRTIDTDGEITQRLQSLMAAASFTSAAMPLTVDAFFGIKNGNKLRMQALGLNLSLNKGFQGDIIKIGTPINDLKYGNLTFSVVGPNNNNLNALRIEWEKWLKKAENEISSPTSLANLDESKPNLSSIVLLAKADGKTMLLTGDARSDHVLDGLQDAGLLTNGKLHVDLLKVFHHGSNRNATKGFFKKITADIYVLSADGKHGNPDLDTLQWIVEAASEGGRQIQLVFTNRTTAVNDLEISHPPLQFGYTVKVKPKTKHAIAIKLA